MGKLFQQYQQLVEDLNRFQLQDLPDFHAISSGLKAFNTWYVHQPLMIVIEFSLVLNSSFSSVI